MQPNESDKTYPSNNPQQRIQTSVLHTTQVVQLFLREIVERRIPPHDRFKIHVHLRHRPAPSSVLRRNRLRARHRHRPRDRALDTREEPLDDTRHEFVRHGKATKVAVLVAHGLVCVLGGRVWKRAGALERVSRADRRCAREVLPCVGERHLWLERRS